MSTLTLEALATAVKFDADNMWVILSDGRQLGVPLAYFPRLATASPAQRKRYLVSDGGIGLIGTNSTKTFPYLLCSRAGSRPRYRKENLSEKLPDLAISPVLDK